ncbi:MAG: hypothetical protein KDB22_10280 [Planctomycetales bacterium]|nr:hypothetical protein [Planctomycetales bacterium]
MNPPPVRISVDNAGNLVIQSNDPAALDRLEEMMRNNRPPKRPYDVFQIKHTSATWVKLSLEEYFEDEDKRNDNRYRYYYFGMEDQKDESRQLGDKPSLRFISDIDTNTIVVIGADDLDRRTIKELIALWDVPEKENEEDNARYTKLVRVQYSRAQSIADALKEAYRDLLSANDKTFQENGGGDEAKRSSTGGASVNSGGGMNFSFKGKLSMGVDSITNSILVSAEGQELLKIITEMIKELDEAARPEGGFEVYQLPPGVNGKSVKEALMRMLSTPKNQEQEKNQQQQQQQQAEQQAAAAAEANRNAQPRSNSGRPRGR